MNFKFKQGANLSNPFIYWTFRSNKFICNNFDESTCCEVKNASEGRGGGGVGVTTYMFLIRMYPVKTKGEPKAGAGFLINYQPKYGANHICYKNATQSRGNLYCIIRETFTIIIVAES